MQESGWSRSAQSQITISAFLAGISATLFVLVFNQKPSPFTGDDLILVLTPLVLAIALFAVASEIFTDALEFDDAGKNVRAVLAHDVAVASLLFALSIIVWIEGLWLVAATVGGFSSYFIKDVVWLSRRTNRATYRDYLVRGRFDHEKEEIKRAIPSAASCLGSAVFGGVYLYQTSSGSLPIIGYAVALAVGYMVLGAIYLKSETFAADVQVTIGIGAVVVILAALFSSAVVLLVSAIFGVCGLVLTFKSFAWTRQPRIDEKHPDAIKNDSASRTP